MKIPESALARLLLEAEKIQNLVEEEAEDEEEFDVEPAAMEILDLDPVEKLNGIWIDPRADQNTRQVIVQAYPEMAQRCDRCNAYDSCAQWMPVLQGAGLPVEMYRGNGGHYWLAVSGVVFDPRADKVVGYPNLSPENYDAEKIIWRGDDYLDKDVLNENPDLF